MTPMVRDSCKRQHMFVGMPSTNNLSQDIDEDLVKLLKEHITLKNAGKSKVDATSVKQKTIWKSNFDYDVLSGCLKHHDEQVRLLALAIQVESKKSTQCFDKSELEMIMTFLIYNMREKFEFVPLIKKALKRMKGSLAVLKRNVAKEEKIRDCESLVDGSYELYEKLKIESSRVAKESRDLIETYRLFRRDFREMCIRGIGPGSTHSHKRSSLQMLQLDQELLDGDFERSLWTDEQGDKLFECLLLDTYETNKEIIYDIAKRIEPRLLRLDDATRVREIIDVALDLGNSIRPIDSITAAYMLKISLLSPVIADVLTTYDDIHEPPEKMDDHATQRLIAIIIERLKEPLKLAEENIVAAAGKHSLFGHLLCIAQLIKTRDLWKITNCNHEAWKKTIGEIINISFRLNNAVSQVVNNSSPEGHFPMDMESRVLTSVISESDGTTVTPQMVLLCSWRTVKEVSLLFGHLSAKCPVVGENPDSGLLNASQLIDIGEHLVTLLFETKHRGAFEQAHVGFGQLCSRLWRIDQECLKKLPKIWLHHLLLAISGLSPGNAKLCATRRSAGVPFMVQALVSSDPYVKINPASAVFHSVMKILLGFTELDETREISFRTKSLMYEDTIFSDFQDFENTKNDDFSEVPTVGTNHETITEIKTHALNILRALFKHAQLGDLAKSYAVDGLIAAIKSYDGKTWAERNAATLLFGSLITRIFGVQRTKDHVNLTLDNRMSGRIFFERYPTLLPFILNELQTFVDARDTPIKPSVQSILLLLSRLYPGFNSDDGDSKWKINVIIKLVSACAKSKVYKTRELAARALVPLMTEKTVHTFIVKLFDKIVSGPSENASLNELHGWMLQIVEIMKSPRFTIEELPLSHVDSFIHDSHWIINNLQSNNSASACFPLAIAYVIALRIFVDAKSTNANLQKIFHQILPHLKHSRLLKDRPGREIYEFEIAEFFVTVMKSRTFEPSNGDVNAETVLTAWNSILTHENVRVQIAGWSGIASVVKITDNEELNDLAVHVALNFMKKTLNPELQESLYDFLHEFLIDLPVDEETHDGKCRGPNNLAIYVVTVLLVHMQNICFQESPSFVRLLGQAYGKIPQICKDVCVQSSCKRIIYKTFLDNTWMGSADVGCRLAISNVMDELFVDSSSHNDNYCLSLDWWTSLLNLLVDDNFQVRHQASLVVFKIHPYRKLTCNYNMMIEFFEKFMERTCETPSVTFAGLFAWSLTLSGDADYEMDESDVFNKCYNYEVFEPLRISELCSKQLIVLLKNYSLDDELPTTVRDWLSERLSTVYSSKHTTARDVITEYGKTVPVIDDKLRAIIDPTHNDKLLQASAYNMLVTAISGH